MTVLCVDPGRRKCGVAVVTAEGTLAKQVVPREDLVTLARQWYERYRADTCLVGGATCSSEVVRELSQGLEVRPTVVDERFSTERARKRYFKENPPRGLWKLVPLGLQVPPVAVDDYVAVILAEDFLGSRGSPREGGGGGWKR